MKLVELFKECTWEGVEPYLQQFPNWDYGKHKTNYDKKCEKRVNISEYGSC